jgi:hypothetical protein
MKLERIVWMAAVAPAGLGCASPSARCVDVPPATLTAGAGPEQTTAAERTGSLTLPSSEPGRALSPPAAGSTRDEPRDDRLVIHTARLRISVADVDASARKAARAAESLGGHIQELSRQRAVLRVPAARFLALLDRLEGLGVVAEREIKADDVTEQHVDLRARLRNARAVEARLKEMLAKARDVKEALEVERELRRVGEEIERLEGLLKHLESRVAFSTVTVEFAAKPAIPSELEPLVRLPFGWLRDLDLTRLTALSAGRAARWP